MDCDHSNLGREVNLHTERWVNFLGETNFDLIKLYYQVLQVLNLTICPNCGKTFVLSDKKNY